MKKNIKYLAILCISLLFTSCLVDDEAPSENNDQGPNLGGFSNKTQNLSAVSDGNEYTFDINMEVKGPTFKDMSGDVTLTVAVDPSASTAIEGTHYRFNSNSITLTSANNYLGALPITVITDGIMAPLPENPILTLLVTDASGGGNVVGNGNVITLTFVYQCYADLAGTYLVTNDGCGPGGSCNPGTLYTTIEANADGSWFVAIGDGGFLGYSCTTNCGLDNWLNLTELCGDILPTADLQYAPCCDIGNVTGGTWDAENGILTLSQTQEFTGNWAGAWTSTYTRQ